MDQPRNRDKSAGSPPGQGPRRQAPSATRPSRGEPIPTTAVRVEEAQLPKKPSKRKAEYQPSTAMKVLIFGGATIFLFISLTKLFSPESSTMAGVSAPPGPGNPYSAGNLEVFEGAPAQSWSNPKASVMRNTFCSGKQTSSACAEEPSHPFVSEFDRAGWAPPEYERYLGWDEAPNPEADRVVEETVVYPNKSFKLFGKD